MLALRKTAPEFGVEVTQVEPPATPEVDAVVVDVAFAGICGSDLHVYEWSAGYDFMRDAMPVTLGHEFSGRVVARGAAVDDLAPGDSVVCWPTVACTECAACRAGRVQDCTRHSVVGLHRNGGFAARVEVPARTCRRLPAALPLDAAALVEPLAVAVNAVDVAAVEPGHRLVVLGPGPIGLLAAWVAQARGAEVLVVGMNDAARLSAAEALGIARRADLAGEELAAAVERSFGQDEVDRVIEATGRTASVADGLSILRSGGVLVVAGIHDGDLALALTPFVRRKLQLRAAHDTTARAFGEAIELLAAHHATLIGIVSHRLPLGRGREAFELARSGTAVKVLLEPGADRQGETM